MVTIYVRRGICIYGHDRRPGDAVEVSDILARQLCDRRGDPPAQREPLEEAPKPAKASAKA